MIDLKIVDGIGMLQLPMNSMGRETEIYPTLIWNKNSALLIDAGLPNSISLIKTAVENEGVPFKNIETLIITHQDIDHFGGANEIAKVEVRAYKEDIPYIQGEKRLIRLNSKLFEGLSNLPEERKKMVLDMFENNPVMVDIELSDMEKLDCFGGIEVIHTPGHTPGHISLYHEPSKTLIAGDALNIREGKLVGPNLQISTEEDGKTALKSLEKLDNYDIDHVICYHGGLYENVTNQRITDLMEKNE